MVNRLGGLGKTGLDSVFGGQKDIVPAMVKGETMGELALKDLVPNPYQPRKTFDVSKMQELISSIKESGVIQPIIVRKVGKKFEIVAGERRWRAAKEAGLKVVPAVIRKYDDGTMMEVALIENMQRSDLDPIEEAEGIKGLMENLRLTQAEVAKKLGMGRSAVTNALRLLKLPAKVLALLTNKELTVGQIRPLLGLENEQDMEEIVKNVIKYRMSARTVESYVSAKNAGMDLILHHTTTRFKNEDEEVPKRSKSSVKDIHVKGFQEELVSYLGTRVKITQGKGKKGGKIIIDFYSDDD